MYLRRATYCVQVYSYKVRGGENVLEKDRHDFCHYALLCVSHLTTAVNIAVLTPLNSDQFTPLVMPPVGSRQGRTEGPDQYLEQSRCSPIPALCQPLPTVSHAIDSVTFCTVKGRLWQLYRLSQPHSPAQEGLGHIVFSTNTV